MDVVENKDIRVGVRLTASQWLGVAQAAEVASVRVSEWVRQAVVEKLQRDSGLVEGVLREAMEQRRQSRYEDWLARQPKKA